MKVKTIVFWVIPFMISASCQMPELIPIEWKDSETTAVNKIVDLVETDNIAIYPSCRKANGFEHHVIGITITNANNIPESTNDKEILANKIYDGVYPEIANKRSYENVTIIFYKVWKVGAIEKKDTYSVSFQLNSH